MRRRCIIQPTTIQREGMGFGGEITKSNRYADYTAILTDIFEDIEALATLVKETTN